MNVLVSEWFLVKSLGAVNPASTVLGSVYRIGFFGGIFL